MKTHLQLIGFVLLSTLVACGDGEVDKDTDTNVDGNAGTVVVSPQQATVPVGGSFAFSAKVDGVHSAWITWSVEGGDENGTISAAGIYTAPDRIGSYTITATNAANPAKKGSASVTVVPAVSAVTVSIAPLQVTLDQGATTTLVATVSGTRENDVTWSVEGGEANGAVTTDGVYTAPHRAGTYMVLATSIVDPSKSASALITVRDVEVELDPTTATVSTAGTTTFSATVSGTVGSAAVTWSVLEGAVGGSITDTGVYTAPITGGTYTVVATSVADPSKEATAQVTVIEVVVDVSPSMVTLDQGDSTTLFADVTGTTETEVVWWVEGGDVNGTVTPAGVYTAPAKAGTYTVLAISAADPSKSGFSLITVRDVQVQLDRTTATVSTAGSTTFSATVTGTVASSAVTWSVLEGATGGSITSSGVYTAPTTGGTYKVVATSVADPSKEATASVTVVPVVVEVSPSTITLDQGATTTIVATVSGTQATDVSWSVDGGDTNGTITTAGVYTAPAKAGTYTVRATSVADASKSASSLVTVRDVEVQLDRTTASVSTAGSTTFSATVTGTTASSAVTWSVQEGATGGSITAAGVYTAPTTGGTYTVVATSVADPSKKASASVTVVAVVVAVSPSTITLDQGATTTLVATVSGTPETDVTWSVDGGGTNGAITTAGVYTAPAIAGTFTVRATSTADATKSGTATVTVRDVQVQLDRTTATVSTAGTTTFSATVTGTTASSAVTWSVQEGATGGSITAAGVYTAPTTGGTYSVVATSVADPSKKATASVTVVAVVVAVSPSTITLDQGATTTLVATVSGTQATDVTWSVDGGGTNGAITTAGIYTAPAKAGTYTVRATSTADATKSGTATVTVRDVQVQLDRTTATVSTAGTTSFSATVTGTVASSAVTWSVQEGATGGSITSAGVYTAPTTGGTFTVVATSVADPSKKASASVTVVPVVVAVNPSTITLDQGASTTLTATVSGTPEIDVTWSVDGVGNNGTVTTAGFYTAPAKAGTYTVRATSTADASKSGTATVTVRDVGVQITPTTITLRQGESFTFTATVTGTIDTAVSWSAIGGSIDGSGTFTAPTAPGTYTVVATSAADGSKIAQATVTVPVAAKLGYVDPPATGWRFVKNTAESTTTRLVLDLEGPAGEAGYGVDATLSTVPTRARWAKVSNSDTEHVANRAYDLGSGPPLMKGLPQGGSLLVGVFQKGTSGPAVSYAGALVSVALELEVDPSVASGTTVPFTVVKAHALDATAGLTPITVAVGALVAE